MDLFFFGWRAMTKSVLKTRECTTRRHHTARPRAGAMPSAPDGAPSPQRVVEVKHGKRKVDIVVEGAATVVKPNIIQSNSLPLLSNHATSH